MLEPEKIELPDDICDLLLWVGSFRGRDHDIQNTVDAAWVSLRKRAGALYEKYGVEHRKQLGKGFVNYAGEPSDPFPRKTQEVKEG